MRQQTLADEGFRKFRNMTRKEHYFDEKERIILCNDLTSPLEPFHPNPQGTARRKRPDRRYQGMSGFRMMVLDVACQSSGVLTSAPAATARTSPTQSAARR